MTARLRDDDQAVAAVVGFVLILAVAISYYAYVAKQDVPRWGAQNERAWDGLVGAAMAQLARDSDSAIGTHAAIAANVPHPPAPQSFDVPLMGRTQPVAPGGTLTFKKDCAGFSVTQSTPFLVDGPRPYGGGCFRFDADPVYSSDFAYVIENGALLRVQGVDSIVLSGPPLGIRNLGTRYDVSLTMVRLDGTPGSTSVDRVDAPVSFIAGASSTRTADLPNANALTWTITTNYPTAWESWATKILKTASLDPARNAVCTSEHAPGPCAGLPAVPTGQVVIYLAGPDTTSTANDISFSLTQGTYTVSMR